MSNSKYEQIIQAINDTNNNHNVDVYVPSVSRNVKFKPMTISHQKKIISAALENTLVGHVNHSMLTCEIIKECCLEPDIELYALDKGPILVGLRCQTLGYDVDTQDEDGNTVKTNIESHVKSFPTIEIAEDLTVSEEIVYDNIKIKTKPHTLDQEHDISKKIYNKIKTNKFENAETVKNTFGDTIIHEYIKFIKSIEINDIHVSFDINHLPTLVKVVESLPITVSSEILKKLNKFRKIEDSFMKISTESGQLTIATDARFYNSE